MSPEIDDKGKIFTEIIHKQPVQVMIQTHSNRIQGTVHKRSDNRMIDKLNSGDTFIPVTNATVYDVDGKIELIKNDFLALNLREIIWLIETKG